jgi:hypothetical protein
VIMVTGRNSALRLSGSSVRPAYPGFIVMKMPVVAFRQGLTLVHVRA